MGNAISSLSRRPGGTAALVLVGVFLYLRQRAYWQRKLKDQEGRWQQKLELAHQQLELERLRWEIDVKQVKHDADFTVRQIRQSVDTKEAQHAIASGQIKETDVAQLGAVINGTNPGRTSADQITLFDGTGVGLQDLAVASAVVDLAIQQEKAIEVDF